MILAEILFICIWFAGEKIDFVNEDGYKDCLLAASIDASVLLKTFLRSLGEPVVTNTLYPKLAELAGLFLQFFKYENSCLSVFFGIYKSPEIFFVLIHRNCKSHFSEAVDETAKVHNFRPGLSGARLF